MVLRLRKAGTEDIPGLVHIYFTTFQSPIVRLLRPDVPAVRAHYRKGLEDAMQQSYTHVYKVIEGEPGSEEVVAFAQWTEPHQENGAYSSADWPAEGNPAAFEELMGKVMEKRQLLLGDREHWHISCLATLPQHQRKGAGTLLMRELCRQADEAGQIAYVESSPLGASTYERFGFTTRDSFTTLIDGEPYVDCCMVREKRA